MEETHKDRYQDAYLVATCADTIDELWTPSGESKAVDAYVEGYRDALSVICHIIDGFDGTERETKNAVASVKHNLVIGIGELLCGPEFEMKW